MDGTVTFEMEMSENSGNIFLTVKNKNVVLDYVDMMVSKGYELYIDSDKNENLISEYGRDFALRNGTWDVHANLLYENNEVQMGFAPDMWNN